MPSHDPRKYVYDIVSSAEFLLVFTRGRTVEDYIQNRPFRSAIERELQIIGEAMLQLDRTSPETAKGFSESRNIIGFRHVLVHGYDSLDPRTVWNIIEIHLAILLDQARTILRRSGT